MNDLLYNKLRAAAGAAWWTLLVGFGILLLVSAWFILALHIRPDWAPPVWAGVSWDTVEGVGLTIIATFKLLLWMILLVAVFLSVWARRLKRLSPQ